MPKDLNDAIDSIFRGIVFIFYNYVYSIFLLLINPVKATFIIVHRLRSGNIYQTRPYVFIFLSFFVELAFPRYYLQLTNILQRRFVDTDQGPIPDTTLLNDIYRRALAIFEPQFLLAITISCIVMCVLLDGAANVLVSAMCDRRIDRRLFKDSFFYLSGFQAVLFCLAFVAIFSGFPGLLWSLNDQYSQAQFFYMIFALAKNILSFDQTDGLLVNGGIFAISMAVFIYALLQPAFIINVFARSRLRPSLRLWLSPAAATTVGWAASAIAAIAFFQVGNFVADQIRPAQAENLTISNVTCFSSLEAPAKVRAIALVANSTSDPARLLSTDFVIKLRKWNEPSIEKENGEQYTVKSLRSKITDSNTGSRTAYALAPGQLIWLEVETIDSFADFLDKGKFKSTTDVCGVSLPGAFGGSIQAFGSVVDPRDFEGGDPH